MKIQKIIVWLVLFNGLILSAQQKNSGITILPDLVRPRYMAADNKRVYIVNNYMKVTGYSVQNFKQNFEINPRRGLGPAEYINAPMILSYGGNIILKTTEKIAYYDLNGKYLSEKRLLRESVIQPIAGNYFLQHGVYSKQERQEYTLVDLLDKNLVKVKNIYKYKAPKINGIISGARGSYRGKLDLMREYLSLAVWNDKGFIADPQRGLYILIFDKTGKTIMEISKDEPKIKITEKDRELLIKKEKLQWGNEESWKQMLKSNDLHCPEFFPHIDRIAVANEKIYIKTFLSQENKTLFIILDFQGKEHARVYLPNSDYWVIYDNRYYFLSYSDDDDEWSLNWATIQV